MGKEITKIDMWCKSCDKIFTTADYKNCVQCSKCGGDRIYRVNSTSFVYAYENYKREIELTKFVMHLRKNCTEEKARIIAKKYIYGELYKYY